MAAVSWWVVEQVMAATYESTAELSSPRLRLNALRARRAARWYPILTKQSAENWRNS